MIFSNFISIAVVIFLVFFIFYKRHMILKMFSIDVSSSTNQFQEQIEATADILIKRLEEKIIHIESLLEEANEKIINLENKIQAADKVLANQNKNMTEFSNKRSSMILDIAVAQNEAVNLDEIDNRAITNNELNNLSIDDYKDLAKNDKRSSIITMANHGYNINEIAKATGTSKGEIQLQLQISKK